MKIIYLNCDSYYLCLKVSFDNFLSVLRANNLKLEKNYLSDFLARCRITPSQNGIPYREFLHRFQDRSDEGMAHNILTNEAHKYDIHCILTNIFSKYTYYNWIILLQI